MVKNVKKSNFCEKVISPKSNFGWKLILVSVKNDTKYWLWILAQKFKVSIFMKILISTTFIASVCEAKKSYLINHKIEFSSPEENALLVQENEWINFKPGSSSPKTSLGPAMLGVEKALDRNNRTRQFDYQFLMKLPYKL